MESQRGKSGRAHLTSPGYSKGQAWSGLESKEEKESFPVSGEGWTLRVMASEHLLSTYYIPNIMLKPVLSGMGATSYMWLVTI